MDKVVWSIAAFDVTSAPAISDGIMTTLNAYDNQIYTWGKGPTAITVTAPDVGVTTATPITIRGTIIDKSAGTQQQAVSSKLPQRPSSCLRRQPNCMDGICLHAAAMSKTT